MRSRLFHTDWYLAAQRKITDFLNTQDRFLSESTVRSTRAVGDAIQDILSRDFHSIVGGRCLHQLFITIRSAGHGGHGL